MIISIATKTQGHFFFPSEKILSGFVADKLIKYNPSKKHTMTVRGESE